MKKVIVFVLANLLILGSAFSETKVAVWFIEKGYFLEADSLVSLCTADSVTVENGFVKLEGEIKYCKARRILNMSKLSEESKKYGLKAKRISGDELYINSNMVLAITNVEIPEPEPEPEVLPEQEQSEDDEVVDVVE